MWWFFIAPPFSSYSNPILYEKGFGYVFLFIGNSAEGLLGTVNRNELRQGIIVVMVSCLLFYRTKVALCELDRNLYGALMAIAAYVRTGSQYTSGKA